jgi:hypothetical protein
LAVNFHHSGYTEIRRFKPRPMNQTSGNPFGINDRTDNARRFNHYELTATESIDYGILI